MRSWKTIVATAVGAAMLLTGAAKAGDLVINSDSSDPAPKKAWESVVDQFKKANPDINVKFNVYDHESYTLFTPRGETPWGR